MPARALDPPGPRLRALGIGLVPLLRRDPLKFMSGLIAKYGDIVFFRSGNERFYLINHPEYIKDLLVTSGHKFAKGRALERSRMLLGEGLLTSEGARHKRQRRLMQPAFSHARISGYAEAMVDFAVRWRERWKDGQTIDIHGEMTALTLAIAGKTLFDADVEGETREVVEAISEAFSLFHLTLLPFSELLERVPLSPIRKLHRARARLDRLIYGIIDSRRKSGQDLGDLLSILLKAQDSEGEGGMSNEQLRDECLTLFLAGHETTANLLTWTWYLLAQNSDVANKFFAEIDAELGGKRPSLADAERLRFSELVIHEALRMYPPAWIVGRRAIEEHNFGPYKIPKRSLVAASQWVMHHDGRYYAEPFVFRPERWLPEEMAKRPKFSYFPFAAGTRQCIGEGFAWAEATMVLATLAQRWRLELMAGEKVEIQPSITLRPKGPVRMVVHARPAVS